MGRIVVRPLSAGQIAEKLDCALRGDGTVVVQSVAALDSATAGDLSFFSDSKHRRAAQTSAASILIAREADADELISGPQGPRVLLLHPAPHLAFAKALDLLFPAAPFVAGIAATATVEATAQVAGAHIGDFVAVGARSKVGVGTSIASHCSIGDDVVIGADCLIHAGVRIGSGIKLGDRCVIQSGAVIGSDGFGFQPTRHGWQKVQQVGGVVVGNDVEIGANTTIDRGAIEDTVIGNGVKIDNLVQIGHNCRIGDHTAIAGCVGIAGSAVIGARCMLGGAAMVNGHLSICDDVIVSGGTLVAASISTPGRYTGVFPYTEHRTWTKIAARLRRSAQ
ncbi:MAG TPA: UDP-3-O-(3-hydroxymyristoyl)glucosamine N-acyltransferase [Casimicrobium huifangae]|nr:UDP-3-O-(3-hydroxymyristoyl)glucosamine N-acyltransferase [Casimicrobium huifangae]